MARHAFSRLLSCLSSVSLGHAWCWASKRAVFLCILLCTKVESQNLTAEMEALEAFKTQVFATAENQGIEEIRGYWDSWRKTDTSPCRWVGISCVNGSVRSIDLSGWAQTIWMSVEALSRLENLEQLLLSRNQMTDIPNDIHTLTNLRHLDLSDNSFDGDVPKSLNRLWNLRSLYLHDNQLSKGFPQLDNLTQLQILSLSRNQLEGHIPNYLNNLTALVSLDLSSNNFGGTVPVLTSLVNLQDLYLENNNLTGFTDPQFPGPRSLKYLFASGNQLGGSLPIGLTELLQLRILNLSSNLFSGEIPKGLARQTTHEYWLDLSQNLLEGRIPEDLFLSPRGFLGFHLNLSYNKLSGSIPEVVPLENGTRWSVGTLDLSHNQLSGSLPLQFFSGSSDVVYLWLEDNQLSGNIVDVLLRPTSGSDGFIIEETRLGNNHFTGDLTRMIGNWNKTPHSTVYFDLSNNLLTMSKTQEYPDPMRSTLEGVIWETQIQEFLIAGNKLEGVSLPGKTSVPFGMYEWATLEVLDVSDNHLVGSIAEEIFNLSNFRDLKVLNFSGNNLTGPVPYNITRLESLITLDVSRNNLSGELPDIPRNSSLWDANLFTGNPRLCGGPLPGCETLLPIVVVITKNGLSVGELIAIILPSVLVPLASCLMLGWRWKVYKKRHKQDADLIATLMEREKTVLMPLRDLKRATGNFAESAQIGEGGFGTVYTGKLQDGTVVAIKRNKREGTEASKQQFLNEVRVLSQVSHRHLVRLLGCCMENKAALLVFEFVPNGTLQEHLQGKKSSRLNWKQRLEIAVQTADALSYLHSAAHFPIVHRDVKSANILLTEKLKVKVADFGISKLASEDTAENTHFSTVAIQGTMGYIDPEYFTCCQLTVKSDVYSFGVVLLELISAQLPIDFHRPSGNSSLITFAAPLIQNQDLDSLIDPILKDSFDSETNLKESVMSVGTLALRCLREKSKDRPDMKEVLKELQTAWLRYNNEGISDFLESPFSIHDESDYSLADSICLMSNSVHSTASYSLD